MISMLFAGDFAPCREYETLAKSKGPHIFGDARPLIRAADCSVVNLECPLTTAKDPAKKNGPAIKAHPDCAGALQDFTVIGLANNHIVDYGVEGLRDSLAAISTHGLRVTGAGVTPEDAKAPSIMDVRGTKIAILALAEREFNQVENRSVGAAIIDPIENLWQIQKARENADFVFVYLHAGNEGFPYPRPGLRKLCRYFIDAGAHGVFCSHPHVAGGYEYYKSRPIVYSLGNLIFHGKRWRDEDWQLGYMAQIDIDESSGTISEILLIPYRQSTASGGLMLLQGEERSRFLGSLEQLARVLANDQEYSEVWQTFVRGRRAMVLFGQYFPWNFRGLRVVNRVLPLLHICCGERKRLARLNALRCDSHRELLEAVLEDE